MRFLQIHDVYFFFSFWSFFTSLNFVLSTTEVVEITDFGTNCACVLELVSFHFPPRTCAVQSSALPSLAKQNGDSPDDDLEGIDRDFQLSKPI